MRVLVLGASGQVGFELLRTLAPLGQLHGVDHSKVDLARPESLRTLLRDVRPDVLINAAAYTAVDKAESEPAVAMAVNGVAPIVMVEELNRYGGMLVHYSTDYVFDGVKRGPYNEDDLPNPQNVYGRSKLAGDVAVAGGGVPYLIFRTSWVYGIRGNNFLLTMLRLFEQKRELRIVADQFGGPTWCRHIGRVTAKVLGQVLSDSAARERFRTEQTGVYHLTGGGVTSWCGFARAIRDWRYAERAGEEPRLLPISSSEYPSPAKRPANSVLSNEKLWRVFGVKQLGWRQQLGECFGELQRSPGSPMPGAN